jgi:hypothetical protein
MMEQEILLATIAEEIAKVNIKELLDTPWESLSASQKEDYIRLYTTEAEVAVKFCDKYYKAGFADGGRNGSDLSLKDRKDRRDMIREAIGLKVPVKQKESCEVCGSGLTTDSTGTYCDNHKCNSFWHNRQM